MHRIVKAGAVLLLISLTLLTVTPFSAGVTRSGAAAVLLALDVCDASDRALSVDDSPALQESVWSLVPAGIAGTIETDNGPSKPFVSINKEEQPPRAIS